MQMLLLSYLENIAIEKARTHLFAIRRLFYGSGRYLEYYMWKIHYYFSLVMLEMAFKCPASDRFNINSQLEHLQAKYVGTGHADLNRFEWAVNIQRDSYASYIGHYPMLAYFAIAENESIGRERYNFMQKMLLPCGLPPEREDD
ncbi:hypothetical protein ACLOJK_011443 [Asimina triloba]